MARNTLASLIGLPSNVKGNVAVPVSALPDVEALFVQVAKQACIYLYKNIEDAYKPTPPRRYVNTMTLQAAPLDCKITPHVKTVGNMAYITVTCELGDGIYHPALYGEHAGSPVNTLALLDYGYAWREPPMGGHIPWFTYRKKGHITEKTREQTISYAKSLGLDIELNIEYDNPIG